MSKLDEVYGFTFWSGLGYYPSKVYNRLILVLSDEYFDCQGVKINNSELRIAKLGRGSSKAATKIMSVQDFETSKSVAYKSNLHYLLLFYPHPHFRDKTKQECVPTKK